MNDNDRISEMMKDARENYNPADDYEAEAAQDAKTKPLQKPEIVKGSIVCYRGGWFRVSCRRRASVNLKNIFGSLLRYQSVPISEVVEDEAAWYKHWQNSEAYKCM
jgi:hypothetical protein